MLLEWVDYYSLVFLAPFLALEFFWRAAAVSAAVFRGLARGALAGILVYEFLHYWYHRFAHEWNWLWRLGHQMHHSAESIDAFGAYYLHPLDAALFTTWAVIAFYPLLGLTPEAGAIAAAFLAFNAAFQHANIRTPRWLGYLVQRPESHGIHHGRGIHLLELFRPAPLGHGVRHVPQPARPGAARGGVLRRRLGQARQHARLATSVLRRDSREIR